MASLWHAGTVWALQTFGRLERVRLSFYPRSVGTRKGLHGVPNGPRPTTLGSYRARPTAFAPYAAEGGRQRRAAPSLPQVDSGNFAHEVRKPEHFIRS